MNLPTQAQVFAGLRYAGVVAGTLATGAATIGMIDAATAANIVTSAQAFFADLQKTIGDAYVLCVALAPVATIALAALGYRSASPKRQIAAVQALPQAQVTVTDPKLAEGIPGVKVEAAKPSAL